MPSADKLFIGCVIAFFLWSSIGFYVAGVLVPRPLAAFLAPTIGWATQSVVALILFRALDFTALAVAASSCLMLGAAAFVVMRDRNRNRVCLLDLKEAAWLILAATIVATMALPAVLPHVNADGIALASPIFDHSKVAFVDEMIRNGVPPTNPVADEAGPNLLAYYYLWHFSAAEIALLGNLSGWEADAALTWFSAFSSALAMMGLARWLANAAFASVIVVILCLTATIRYFLTLFVDWETVYDLTGWPSGFGGWLNQATWAPQHLLAAACLLVALVLLPSLKTGKLSQALWLSILSAAAFQASVWVGGVALLLVFSLVACSTILDAEPAERQHFALLCVLSAALAVAISLPLVLLQFAAVANRGGEFPIAIMAMEVLGDTVPSAVRRALDIPAYWIVFLPVELHVVYVAGVVMAGKIYFDKEFASDKREFARNAIIATVTCLVLAGFVRGAVVHNNDLSWRGAIPAILCLTALSAAGVAMYWRRLSKSFIVAVMMLLSMALFDGVIYLSRNMLPETSRSGKLFEASVAMWRAVRRHSGPLDRVANNPYYLADMTTWPINISWALLSNRRSCYANKDMVLAFVPGLQNRAEDYDALFKRVFAGTPQQGDVGELATTLRCDIFVVTASDSAWRNDPFLRESSLELVDSDSANWRIYRKR